MALRQDADLIRVTLPFFILALLTTASAVAAMSLRNLVHCALCLALSFFGIAALYLQLDVQFVGFAQILVYVGAVAVLIVFAILLTRGSESSRRPFVTSSWLVGLLIALLVFATVGLAVQRSSIILRPPSPSATATVQQIGTELMTNYVLALEVVALLLTAALIGAVVIAVSEKSTRPSTSQSGES
jgi:NADH-quinone oxidoreductase subunit J